MTIRLIELAVRLLRPFTTSAGSVDERRTVLVGRGEDGLTGWGEAAPYPGVTTDTVDGVWASLTGETDALTPSAAAALDQADADLAARQAGQPLWGTMGGVGRPLLSSLSVGFDEDPIERLEATGAGAVKLKIQPGNDVHRVRLVRDALPNIVVGVDANGSYTWDGREALLELDRFDVAYVEQPFPADDLGSHAGLREEVLADVVLDESIDSTPAAIAAIEAGAADVLIVKPGRIGLAASRTIHDLALAAGLRIKASGLLETAVGRAHTLAVATLPGAVYSDIADDGWFLEASTGQPRPTVANGWITVSDAPGIGVDPDLDALAPYVVQEASVTPPGARGPG